MSEYYLRAVRALEGETTPPNAELIRGLVKEIEALRNDGWRACIDHIIKPADPCPVCRLGAVRSRCEEVRDMSAVMERAELAEEILDLINPPKIATVVERRGIEQCGHASTIDSETHGRICLDCGDSMRAPDSDRRRPKA